MATWIQSLSWALIYSLCQGIVVYSSLMLVLKLLPAVSARSKYHLSLSALIVLLAWFGITWWQQFHLLVVVDRPFTAFSDDNKMLPQFRFPGTVNYAGHYGGVWSPFSVILPWLSVFYGIGLALMLLRLTAGMLQLFSLRSTGITPAEPALNQLLFSLKKKLHLTGKVRLFIAAKAQVPMVIGCLKPIILMPAAAMAQLSTEQLETILLHELAHIKRFDYLVNILQILVETILFFNPFVWKISAIIRREREHCCDDLVLDHTREPLFYATALAALASHSGPSFAVAASGQHNHLFHRIKRIMEMKKNPLSYSKMLAAILIMTTITCTIAWIAPSFAHAPEPAKPNTLPAGKGVLESPNQDENQLIKLLSDDQLINEVKGFVIEKKKDQLYINGRQQTAAVAARYLSSIKKEALRVEVFPLEERLRRHPQSGFLQIVVPVRFSSPCIDYSVKPGC